MAREEGEKGLEGTRRGAIFVWRCCVVVLVLFMTIPIAIQVSDAAFNRPSSSSSVIQVTLWISSLLATGILYWSRKRFLSKEGIRSVVEKNPSMIFMRYVLTLALAEYIGTNGFLAGLLLRDFWSQYLLIAISGVFVYVLRPPAVFR